MFEVGEEVYFSNIMMCPSNDLIKGEVVALLQDRPYPHEEIQNYCVVATTEVIKEVLYTEHHKVYVQDLLPKTDERNIIYGKQHKRTEIMKQMDVLQKELEALK